MKKKSVAICVRLNFRFPGLIIITVKERNEPVSLILWKLFPFRTHCIKQFNQRVVAGDLKRSLNDLRVMTFLANWMNQNML